jgi:acyl-coenzyme A synthetase/AMP-(fatty) acid ligase
MPACLHTPFFEAARRHPERLAVVDAKERVTYGQLAHRARLAGAHLRAAGVGRGDRIALMLDRSAVTIAAMLGALSQGVACVCVDMRWPAARRRRLLDVLDARAAVLAQPDAPEAAAVPLRFTPAWLASPIACKPTETHGPGTPGADDAADNLACILFTAGTAGPPRGVCLTHRAARAFVDWIVQETALGPQDRIAGLSPFTGDNSLFDIHATLAAGATLVLVDHAHLAAPSGLGALLADEAITALYTVPTVLSVLATRGGLERHPLPAMRLVMSSGEPFAGSVFAQLQQALAPSVAHYHFYGSVETNVCTMLRLSGTDVVPARLPIGRARPGIDLLGMPLEAGSAYGTGAVELCVAGDALMSGYWGDVRDLAPHWRDDSRTGRRHFRTGDVARQDARGVWHYLGRVERPLTIDGRWVDTAEVERMLLREPGVAHCAVAANERGRDAAAKLVAHVVPRPGHDLARLKLRLAASCIETLPEHMQPQAYVIRGELPMKGSGRVDRSALGLGLRDSADPVLQAENDQPPR